VNTNICTDSVGIVVASKPREFQFHFLICFLGGQTSFRLTCLHLVLWILQSILSSIVGISMPNMAGFLFSCCVKATCRFGSSASSFVDLFVWGLSLIFLIFLFAKGILVSRLFCLEIGFPNAFVVVMRNDSHFVINVLFKSTIEINELPFVLGQKSVWLFQLNRGQLCLSAIDWPLWLCQGRNFGCLAGP